MKRGQFIRNSASLLVPVFLKGISLKGLAQEELFATGIRALDPESDRILVIVQLFGGNDGLNTVIPMDQYDNYYKARPNIALAEGKLLLLTKDRSIGLHPSLSGFLKLYEEQKLAMVQSVGYPGQNFSHFRSSDIWMSGADSAEALNTGWMGRYLHSKYVGYPDRYPNQAMTDPIAIQMGPTSSFLFQSPRSPMALNIENPLNIFGENPAFGNQGLTGTAREHLDFIKMTARQSSVYSKVIRDAYERSGVPQEYPENPLANQLKVVARLIQGGLKTRVYMVSYDGFDTHAQQVVNGETDKGRHADLLEVVGSAIYAFQRDLELMNLADRVMGMTFSEFGRRILSNDSLGTDHGSAAPLFVFGSRVKGGVYGENPRIGPVITEEDNIPMQFDFRQVYASLLQNWMGQGSKETAECLRNEFKIIPFVR